MIPLLGLVFTAGAGLLGVGAHAESKEVNERAQKIAQDAQRIYDNAKSSLEKAQQSTEASLVSLGYAKKSVLDGSMQQFIQVFDRLKDISLLDSAGLNELSKFDIDSQDILQIQEMTDIYDASISSGAAGAATGAVVALAASGYLPVVTGTLSIAGSALAIGEIGVAADLVGSALSFGAAMTPLAAVAAPVVLFTGISASMKADENYEKAQTMRAQAEAAVEKMAVAETLCMGISQRSDMFNSLLKDLDNMFSVCVALLDRVTKRKMRFHANKKLTPIT